MAATDQILQELKSLNTKLTEQGTVIARLEQGQKSLEQGQKSLEQAQAQTKTMLKVLEAGQNDIRENMVTKTEMQDIKIVLVKHQKRIENLEENTSTPNPHKN